MTDTVPAETQVIRILGEILEVSADELRAQPTLAVHQWDSLSSLEALCQLESQFAIRLDLRVFSASRTVGDLVALISATAPRAPAA